MTDFDSFFKAATTYRRFPYQRRLATATALPQILRVPTGTGKTAAAVLAWLWRRRTRPTETPRRLVYCLPMRVLVEQTRTFAILWLHRLGLLAGEAKLDEEEQRVLKYEPNWGEDGKVGVATVMGGETDDRWREHPENDALLIGTQDMLISRALNRGYAEWPQGWPIDFGLLNVDTLWVMDEVQLMGPARTTSVQLQLFTDEHNHAKEGRRFPSRHTLWMSATIGAEAGSGTSPTWMRTPEWQACSQRCVIEAPSADDLVVAEFNDRWVAPKQLDLRIRSDDPEQRSKRQRSRKSKAQSTPDPSWTAESVELVDRILDEARSPAGRTVLVFVNRVARARNLYRTLKDRCRADIELLLAHSRFRPRDRRTTEEALTRVAPAGGRVVISTQALEAGVDLDAQALFTEICPWPSLVQRLGRLNRKGREKDPNKAPAVVLDVPLPPPKDSESAADYRERANASASLPYGSEDLDAARKMLRGVLDNGGDLSPKALSMISAPIELAGPVLRRFDLDDLFDTDPDLAGGFTDVSPFVRAMDREVDAFVLWRRLELPPEEQPPVHPDEICAAPFHEVQRAFKGRDVWILTLATRKRNGPAWRRSRASEVRPGDTVMVDLTTGCYDDSIGWLGEGKDSRERKPSAWIDRLQRGAETYRAWAHEGSSGEPRFHKEDIIDTRVDGRRASGEDPRSYTKRWLELGLHLEKAEERANDIAVALGLPDEIVGAIRAAARWHDVGKALERDADGETQRPFQKMLLSAGVPEEGHPRDGSLYAKSNRRGGTPSGLRHEVASALAYLSLPDASDLVAYLILSHHGKVRLLPSPWNDEGPWDANGVRPGDRIPAIVLPAPNGEVRALDPELFLSSPERPGWQGRVGRLLEEPGLGPYRLAYLEALVRVADWRAE